MICGSLRAHSPAGDFLIIFCVKYIHNIKQKNLDSHNGKLRSGLPDCARFPPPNLATAVARVARLCGNLAQSGNPAFAVRSANHSTAL